MESDKERRVETEEEEGMRCERSLIYSKPGECFRQGERSADTQVSHAY